MSDIESARDLLVIIYCITAAAFAVLALALNFRGIYSPESRRISLSSQGKHRAPLTGSGHAAFSKRNAGGINDE